MDMANLLDFCWRMLSPVLLDLVSVVVILGRIFVFLCFPAVCLQYLRGLVRFIAFVFYHFFLYSQFLRSERTPANSLFFLGAIVILMTSQ